MSARSIRPVRALLTVAWLTLLWVLLWRDASWQTVAAGVLVGAAVHGLLGGRVSARSEGGVADRPVLTHGVRPLALVSFLGYFAWKLVESNIVIAREVVTPQNQIETGIIGVALPGCSDLVATIVANAVSLTPGTLSLELRRPEATDDPGEPPMLFVHVLHLADIEVARDDVRTIARKVQAALPAREVAR